MKKALAKVKEAYHHMHDKHGKHIVHTGKVGMGAEAMYHAAELLGMHSGTVAAAAILLLVLLIKVLHGEVG